MTVNTESQSLPLSPSSTPSTSARQWAGRALSGLAVLFLLFDASMKLVRVPEAVKGTTDLGYPGHVLVPLGIIQLTCTALYLFRRTSVMGALLFTGYLGGAVATHVRVEHPLFSHVLFPIYVAMFLWGGLVLRDRDLLNAIFPGHASR